MARFVVILDNADRSPVTTIRLPDDSPSHLAVEAFQKQLALQGKPTGVTWRLVEGDAIDALVASARLEDMMRPRRTENTTN